VIELTAKKLAELKKIAPLAAASLKVAFSTYDFRLVSSELINVQDEDSPLGYDPALLVQLAVRKGYAIFIDRNLWGQLGPKNQVALLFHEMIYAFQPIEPTEILLGYDETGKAIFQKATGQSSQKARALTGYLFTEKLSLKGTKGLAPLALSNRGFNLFQIPPHQKLKMRDQDGATAFFSSISILHYGTQEALLNFDLGSTYDQLLSWCNLETWAGSPEKNYQKSYYVYLTIGSEPGFGIKRDEAYSALTQTYSASYAPSIPPYTTPEQCADNLSNIAQQYLQ
jgi:hypothetical protein